MGDPPENRRIIRLKSCSLLQPDRQILANQSDMVDKNQKKIADRYNKEYQEETREYREISEAERGKELEELEES